MLGNKERLAYEMSEFRSDSADVSGAEMSDLVGHAAVFDVETEIQGYFGSFRESIAQGAFTASIREQDDVRALFNHDPNQVLGRTHTATLKLKEDSIGLHCRISPPNTQLGRDVSELVGRGDISQMSFGFIVRREEIIDDENEEMIHRRILEAELYDVSPVTFPAFDVTDIGIEKNYRSSAEIFTGIEEVLNNKINAKNFLKSTQEARGRMVIINRLRINID